MRAGEHATRKGGVTPTQGIVTGDCRGDAQLRRAGSGSTLFMQASAAHTSQSMRAAPGGSRLESTPCRAACALLTELERVTWNSADCPSAREGFSCPTIVRRSSEPRHTPRSGLPPLGTRNTREGAATREAGNATGVPPGWGTWAALHASGRRAARDGGRTDGSPARSATGWRSLGARQ